MSLRQWATLLTAATLLVLASGCTFGDDDEMVPPTRTVTASPSAETTVAPATVPVGHGVVAAGDVVWASGTRLHVGRRSVDLPVAVDAFVAVPGGVYVLARDELWFTDLSRLRGTGITGVTHLGATADGGRIVVTSAGSAYAFDTGTGRSVSSAGVEPVTSAERLGGPDRTGVAVPAGFALAGWSGTDVFYGAVDGSKVVACRLSTKTCRRLGTGADAQPVVFGTGR